MDPIPILNSNSSPLIEATTIMINPTSTTTTPVVYNNHLFLQTATCQAIAGAFTWAAILITGYHVRATRNKKNFIFIDHL